MGIHLFIFACNFHALQWMINNKIPFQTYTTKIKRYLKEVSSRFHVFLTLYFKSKRSQLGFGKIMGYSVVYFNFFFHIYFRAGTHWS